MPHTEQIMVIEIRLLKMMTGVKIFNYETLHCNYVKITRRTIMYEDDRNMNLIKCHMIIILL